MIGGVIMVHGDDDGLRVPPAIAPYQIVIVPMLRDDEGDAAILAYGQAIVAALTAQTAMGEPVRVLFDKRTGKAQSKRWEWLKKGAPLVVEIGPRDMAEDKVAVIRRDRLYRDDGKLNTDFQERLAFIDWAGPALESIQHNLFAEARGRLQNGIRRDLTDWAAIQAYFKSSAVPGWVEISWSRPTGAALAAVVERIKALKLTMRNVPQDAAPATGTCPLTDEPAVERILIGRAY